ncbi:MAG TPA: MFS transporter [Steroidobacteraceae bacterium]|nr:MFS transporter [Steroidobacteraceae bacterium]
MTAGRPVAQAAAGPARARAVLSLIVLATVTALNNVDRGLFALLLPEIQKSIVLTDAFIGVLLGPGFMVIYTLAGLPIAGFADRSNRSTLIAIGLAFWSLVTAATAVATRPLHLLFLRAALGIGEATNIAPSTALVSDLFSRRQRALAFAVISVGTPMGTLLCYPFAGRISAAQGWRAAFVAMGLIGLAVAVATVLIVRDPRPIAPQTPLPLRTGAAGDSLVGSLPVEFARAWCSRPFRRLVIAGGFFSFNYAAMAVWIPAFLARAHGLSVQDVGATLGIYRGAFGILAALAGGGLVSLLAGRDERWIAWVPAALCALIVPAELMLLFSPARSTWQAGLGMETVFLTAAIPCTFTLLAHVADARARAMWAACYFMVFNLIGQSLGPFSVGVLSEWLTPWLSTHALRYALLIAPASIACAGLMFMQLAGAMKAQSPEA